ncbi:uncharacterized protein RCC_05931 [Ramularia collo-cygni]|uniref:DUF7605 domain-containing protein n=1 Tax=Ramularia collo-cygni TaxID=112498 RepID=A0A2D3VBI7_9PEZI|nr:uncharacterized protein RCC_05931 [Ramularia collo-cygni]CZT20074.1 uncharacterized protein RCC_05931 [Ramularia collo-cygni]
MGMLGANLPTHSSAFGDICQEAVTKLNEGQRELSRQFTPVIAAAMEPVYEQCNQESGKGSFARMKAAMAAHVGGKGPDMFQDASEQVKASLRALCKGITKFYLEKMDDVFLAMKRDYLGIVGGVVGQITMPKEERMVRRAVDEAISAADGIFSEVLDGDLEDLKVKFSAPIDDATGDEPKDDIIFTENDDEDDAEEDGGDETADENDDADDIMTNQGNTATEADTPVIPGASLED